MYTLVGTDGTRFYNWPLKIGKHTVGRSQDADFFLNHKTVSRKHAVIEITDNGEIYIEDLKSRNGTTFENVVITDRIKVKLGDQFMFGQAEFKVADADGSEAGQAFNTARLADFEPEKSVFLPIDEVLKPLPSKVTDIPEVLPTLFDMAKILVLQEPREVMLNKILKMVSKVIPAERLAILGTGEENEILTLACLLPSGKDPGSFRLSRTIINEILTKTNSILIDPQEDPRFASQDSIVMSQIRSAMAVPLFDGGKVLGILYVDTTSPLHRYNDDYLRLLATFGNLIASRLLNFELVYERQQKQVFEAELRRASMIQDNLMLKDMPEYPGFKIHALQEQCRAVGGDLYDVIKLEDGRLLFFVADVSGKGLGAALLTSNILASFRILYDIEGFELARIVKQVSLQLWKYSSFDDFATLFIGIIDPETNIIKYINAGHNPPAIIRNNGNIDLLEPCGTMIGAFDFSDWDVAEVKLEKDETLVIFTDGVTEADHDGEFYGENRLNDFIKSNQQAGPKEMCEKIMHDVLEFVGESPRSDDITMLAVKKE